MPTDKPPAAIQKHVDQISEPMRPETDAALNQMDAPAATARHTPGPWKDGPVFQKEGRAIFITDKSKPGIWQRRLDDKAGIFSEADARLIAAARNAIGDEFPITELQTYSFGELHRQLERLKRDAAQRDELLAALKTAQGFRNQDDLEKAKAIIAKAESANV